MDSGRVLAVVVIRDGHHIVTVFCDGDTLVGGSVSPQVGVSCCSGKRRAGAFTEGGLASDFHNRKRIDGQVEGVHLFASIRIRMRVGVCAALGVSFTVAIRPCVGFATGDTIGLVCRFVDGEVKRDYRVAARRVGDSVRRRVIAFGVSVSIDPGEAIASCMNVGVVALAVDGEVQRHHGIATRGVGGGKRRRIVA